MTCDFAQKHICTACSSCLCVKFGARHLSAVTIDSLICVCMEHVSIDNKGFKAFFGSSSSKMNPGADM